MTLEKSSSATNRTREINLSAALKDIVAEIAHRAPSFAHIDPKKLHICISSNRNNGRGATFGKLVPLKFKGGQELMYYRGRCYTIPRVVQDDTRILYLIYFYSPRFFDLSAQEKLRVIFHELYHINPDFDGDIRRFGKSGSAHGNSKKKFDLRFEMELREFLVQIAATPHWDFLAMDTAALFASYDRVVSHRMRTPKPMIIG